MGERETETLQHVVSEGTLCPEKAACACAPSARRSLRCSALRWTVTGVPYAGALGARGAAGDGDVAFGVAHNVGGGALVDTLFPVSCRAWRPLRCSAQSGRAMFSRAGLCQQRISRWRCGADPARMHLRAAISCTALRSKGHKRSRQTGRTPGRRRRERRRRRPRKISPTPLLPPMLLLLLFPNRQLRDQPFVSIPSKRATILVLRMPFQPPNRTRRWNLIPASTRMCRSERTEPC